MGFSINDIVSSKENLKLLTENEVKYCKKVSKLIEERLNNNDIFKHTKWPEKFAKCRTEGQLFDVINECNEWLDLIGKVKVNSTRKIQIRKKY